MRIIPPLHNVVAVDFHTWNAFVHYPSYGYDRYEIWKIGPAHSGTGDFKFERLVWTCKDPKKARAGWFLYLVRGLEKDQQQAFMYDLQATAEMHIAVSIRPEDLTRYGLDPAPTAEEVAWAMSGGDWMPECDTVEEQVVNLIKEERNAPSA